MRLTFLSQKWKVQLGRQFIKKSIPPDSAARDSFVMREQKQQQQYLTLFINWCKQNGVCDRELFSYVCSRSMQLALDHDFAPLPFLLFLSLVHKYDHKTGESQRITK